MPESARDHASPAARRRGRTYVVLACTRPFGSGEVVPLGTVGAPTLAAARAVAAPLARARGGVAADVVLRVQRASACRRAWLLLALTRDGEAPPPDRAARV